MKLDHIIASEANKTTYRDGNIAIKLFAEGYSKSDILNEALNQARVEETGLPIPAILEVCKIEGKWAIVHEFIEGKTLAELMEEDPENLDLYLELFVELQMDVHDTRAPLLNKLSDKMYRKINEADIDDTTRYELHTRLSSMPVYNKVCHGDFQPSNIVIDAEGCPHILDWAHATQGNASADVARTYLVFCLQGKRDLAERYLKRFCEKSVTSRQYVERWLPIVACSQSVKGKPEERDLLRSWFDVVEYE